MMNEKGKPTLVFKIEEIVKTGVPCLKTLHRNILYPYQSVQEKEDEPPFLVCANILLHMFFSER